MHRSLPLLLLLATVAACGPVGGEFASNQSQGTTANDAASTESIVSRGEAYRDSGPDIGPGTAPGVAFNYRYAFRLDAARVAPAQQEHQRLCERYTLGRCRITGMLYRAANDEDVEAMLAFRVDPALAAQFGRESVQAVVAADGMLTNSEITGTEVGGEIESAGNSLAELSAQLERIEARLRAAGTGSVDRERLEQEAAALRQQIRELRTTREGQQRSMAMTPMLFRYGSGDLAPGPARPPSVREALRDTGDDFLYSLNLLLVVLVRLLPWGVAALLVWGVVRFLRRRLVRGSSPAQPEPALGI